jgi:hypothetical protein
MPPYHQHSLIFTKNNLLSLSLACNLWNFHQERFSPLNSSLQIHPSTQELQTLSETLSPLSYVEYEPQISTRQASCNQSLAYRAH